MHLLDLPDCMLISIFEYLNYDEIAKKRIVCHRIDRICQRMLNLGFQKILRRHSADLKQIKSHLPRRESERRCHPLSKHVDILTCIETRISMLSMTYTKYMELELCCFIPGKVVDEVLKILRIVESSKGPLKPHEILQELRDISSMAIEHFDEKIANLLKKSFLSFHANQPPSIAQSMAFSLNPGISSDRSLNYDSSMDLLTDPMNKTTPASPPHINDEYQKSLKRMEKKYKLAMRKVNQMMHLQNKQTFQIRMYSSQISDLNTQVVELKRRLEETETKNREMSANINQLKIDAAILSPTTLPSTSTPVSGPKPRNIKPRTATIILKRRIAESALAMSGDIKKTKSN